jgi:DeoR/GlpR family transcriptional regulator of sugar metabolism
VSNKGGVRMSKKATRENHLLSVLSTTHRMTTAEAVELLGISVATVRRLFNELEHKGLIVRNYGGIQLPGAPQDYSFESSEKVYSQEKRTIGATAAALVQDGDTIFLDSGTTLMQMTLALSQRIAGGDFRSLNVVTNSIANIQVLSPSPQVRVILLGGEYNHNRRDFSGPLTERFVAPFHFTKSFFGCEGLAPEMGFSSNQLSISSLNTCILARTDKRYVLLDDSKFGRYSLVTYAALKEITSIVTNAAPDEALAQALEEAKVTTILAKEG